MSRPPRWLTLLTAVVVTSYISFGLVAVNRGFGPGFGLVWLRSWGLAAGLAFGSLRVVGPFLNARFNPMPMPYVNIRITRDGVTAAQKQALVAGATELLHTVLGKAPATTFVIIDEVDTDNWGIAGELVTHRRHPAAAPPPQP